MANKYYKQLNTNWIYELKENEALISPNPENNSCVEITKEEYDALAEIKELKEELKMSDYIACKLAEVDGDDKAALKQEYATQLTRRNEIRARINELESLL